MRVCWLLAWLSGCGQLLDLIPVGSAGGDASDRDAVKHDALVPDGFRLVIPPDGGTTCPPSIDLSTWTFGPQTLPGQSVSPYQVAPYTATDGMHMFVSSADVDNAWHVYDWDLAANMLTELPALELASGSRYSSIGLTPTGDIAWLSVQGDGDGIYMATAVGGWSPQAISLGLLLGTDPQVGSIGFYDGTARMVVAINPGGSDPHLAELSSSDGVTWTRVASSFGTSFDGQWAGVNAPALTPDGCTLVFNGVSASLQAGVYVASRGSDGTFGPPVAFISSSSASPAISADRTLAWYVQILNGYQLFEGHP